MTTLSKEDEYRAALERIIRPIVEGQIRGFIKEHPNILLGVDWYKKPGRDCAKTLCGSLSKRIVRDLVCGSTSARLVAALVEVGPASPPSSAVELRPAEKVARAAICGGPGVSQTIFVGPHPMTTPMTDFPIEFDAIANWLRKEIAITQAMSAQFYPHNMEQIERKQMLEAILVRLRSHPSVPVSEWQPIETAPKDGTHILAAWAMEEETQTWLETVWAEAADGDAAGWWAINWGHLTDGMEPLAWMPLPIPPASLNTRGE